jgi:hypothetical protein
LSTSIDAEDSSHYELVSGADASYIPIRPFAEWANGALVTPYWDQYTRLFERERAEAGAIRSDEVVNGALRAAATNTGAIEGLHGADRGLTLTVIELAEGWQRTVRAQEGSRAVELIQAALEGYEMAFDFMTGSRDIAEAWIRQIHEVVCKPQRTYRVLTPQGWQDQQLPLGAYKSRPNHVLLRDGSIHSYAPVHLTGSEMHRYVEELRSEAFLTAHPTIQAAYAHHALTAIHPFADGNGRVARILASIFTLRSATVPFVVLVDEQVPYFDSLAAADDGDPNPLITFVAERVIGTIGLLIDLLKAGTLGVEGSLERVRRAMTGQGGLTHSDIDLTVGRLAEALRNGLQGAISEVELPQGVSVTHIGSGYPVQPLTPEHRPAFGQPAPAGGIQIASPGPAEGGARVLFDVVIKKDPNDRYPLVIREFTGFQVGSYGFPFQLANSTEVRLDEVHPQISVGFQMRAQAWANRITSELMDALAGAVEESLRQQGYTTLVPRTEPARQKLILERPPAWEYLLFAAELLHARDALDDRYRDHEMHYGARTGESVTGERVPSYLTMAADDAIRIMRAMDEVMAPDVQERAFGTPGQPGDAERITHLAKRWNGLYDEFLAWAARLRGVNVPSEYRTALELLARFADDPIRTYREFVDNFTAELDQLPAALAAGQPVHLKMVIRWTIPPEVSEAFQVELARLRAL